MGPFDSLFDDVEGTETLNVDYIIRGLAQYFPPVNLIPKKKRAMRLGMKKPRSLTVRHYAARLIYLNEYLESFSGATLTDKIGVTEQDEILLNSMPNSCSRQAYVKGFDCENISFKNTVNLFECIEINQSIYKDLVEPYYKNPPGEIPTVLVTSGKIEQKLPRHGLSSIRVRVLASAEKGM